MGPIQPNDNEKVETGFKDRIRHNIKTDPNIIRFKSLSARAIIALPSATSRYLLNKIPIAEWLPNYSTSWLLNDIVAGATIGLLLVPQSLAYARIANIPEHFGLMSSWLPPLVYSLLGTSRDVCPGPTSIVGVLIAEVYNDFRQTGIPIQTISGVLTFLVGIVSLIVGLLNFGFLLNFISAPVLSGFVCSAGILTILSQIPALFGNTAGSGTIGKIHAVFSELPQAKPWDTLIGLSCILILILIQKAGSRWGKQNKIIWVISTCRNAIIIIMFTIISFIVNRNAETPHFAISSVDKSNLVAPIVPSSSLIRQLAPRCITIFIAIAMEHLAISKTYSRQNGYKSDESQELFFIGVANLLNGFFPTMPVGGSFSRSAVNSESGVKTPLAGLMTSAFVLLSLYFLTGALYWIPKATLSAVIITAVSSLLVSPATFYSYWRISLPDFIASMISFWVALLVSIEMGIAIAVSFNVLQFLLRITFSQMVKINSKNWSTLYPNTSYPSLKVLGESLVQRTLMLALKQPIIFLNAERIKSSILDSYYKYSSSMSDINTIPETSTVLRSWASSRKSCHASTEANDLASICNSVLTQVESSLVLILDLSHVFYIDVTGIQALSDARSEIFSHTQSELQWRFVGLRPRLRTRLELSGWKFHDIGHEESGISIVEEAGENKPIRVFEDMYDAVFFGRDKS